MDKVSRERVRVRYQDSDPEQAVGDLLDEVRNSLRDIMLDDGILSDKPFEDQCPVDASLDDIDASRVAWFVEPWGGGTSTRRGRRRRGRDTEQRDRRGREQRNCPPKLCEHRQHPG